MKKGLLFVAVLLATLSVKAQDIYLGGSVNVWRNSSANSTAFKIAPEIGYNFNESWAIGAELAYAHDYVAKISTNAFSFAPYIRWSFYENDAVRLFLDGTASIGISKAKDADSFKQGQIGLRPGIAVKLNDNFAFIAKCGFLGYQRNIDEVDGRITRDAFGLKLNSENLSLGFHYNF